MEFSLDELRVYARCGLEWFWERRAGIKRPRQIFDLLPEALRTALAFYSQQVVDWYHAKQHLCQAAYLIAGEGTPAAQHRLTTQETSLFEGQAEQVAECIAHQAQRKRNAAKELRRQAGYFRDNQCRMHYLEMRENGYPIGSGIVESGCK